MIQIREEQVKAMEADGGPACVPCQTGPKANDKAGPVTPVEPKSWIGVLLVDDAGRPVVDQDVEITLKNGTTVNGRTGKDGKVRIEGVPAGQGMATFAKIPDWAEPAGEA